MKYSQNLIWHLFIVDWEATMPSQGGLDEPSFWIKGFYNVCFLGHDQGNCFKLMPPYWQMDTVTAKGNHCVGNTDSGESDIFFISQCYRWLQKAIAVQCKVAMTTLPDWKWQWKFFSVFWWLAVSVEAWSASMQWLQQRGQSNNKLFPPALCTYLYHPLTIIPMYRPTSICLEHRV